MVLGVMAAGAVLSFLHYDQMSKKIWRDHRRGSGWIFSFSRQNFCWLPFLRSGITWCKYESTELLSFYLKGRIHMIFDHWRRFTRANWSSPGS